MGTLRYFSGSREAGKRSPAGELMRLELKKKGRLPAVERYKFLLNKKIQEAKKEAMLAPKPGRIMSKKAEDALKQIAMKKAAKQEKIMRRMVVVQPRVWHNGSINAKGKIHDVAGNYVGRVNTKNAKISFFSGFAGGKYKPKSSATELFIQDSINKYSPYFINLRKMQDMQQGTYPLVGSPLEGNNHNDVINLYGRTASSSYAPQQQRQEEGGVHGANQDGAFRTGGGGVTSLGVMSDNVWGNFVDNAWGTTVDNVWGGTESNIWGGLGAGGLWGYKGVRIFGTGNGTNYLAKMANKVAAFLGFRLGKASILGSNRGRNNGRAGNVGQRAAAGSSRTGGPRTTGRSGGGSSGARSGGAPRSSGRGR